MSDESDASGAAPPEPAVAPERDASPAGAPLVPPRLSAMSEAVSVSVGVTLATGIVMTFAFDPRRAGTQAMLIAIGLFYALTGAFTLRRLDQRGELRRRFRPAGGDLTLGAVVAGALYGVAHLVDQTVAAHGSLREAWIMRVYLQLGDPEAPDRMLVGGAVFVIAALEELVWRGLVMRSLEAVCGARRALVVTSLLFATAHAPTLYLLGDATAGPNPLIVLAALGCGTVWGLVYLRTSRLVPALFAHALFSWAVVEFPIWRP
jgi:membrane protease YdiL (CAAX protease family)